jgi:hypothetical protein
MNTTYDTLFSYGHLRANYLNSDMTLGKLSIKKFLRLDHLDVLRKELIKDSAILTKTPNTDFQVALSPISRQCLWELHSGIMIRTIENITNIPNLLPDTHCKQSRLLLASSANNAGIASWHNTETQQEVAIALIIFLDSGDAVICTDYKILSEVLISSDILQIIYWKKIAEIAEENHANRN